MRSPRVSARHGGQVCHLQMHCLTTLFKVKDDDYPPMEMTNEEMIQMNVGLNFTFEQQKKLSNLLWELGHTKIT